MADDKTDYGKTCNARFWPQPHERSCALPPGHEGEHRWAIAELSGLFPRPLSEKALAYLTEKERAILEPRLSDAAERFYILQWAGSRPGVISLLKALKEANYDENGTEYLRRVVTTASGFEERRRWVTLSHTRSEVDYSQTVDVLAIPGHLFEPIPGAPLLDAPTLGVEAKRRDARPWHYVCSTCAEGREEKTIGGLSHGRPCAECGGPIDNGRGHLVAQLGHGRIVRGAPADADERLWCDVCSLPHSDEHDHFKDGRPRSVNGRFVCAKQWSSSWCGHTCGRKPLHEGECWCAWCGNPKADTRGVDTRDWEQPADYRSCEGPYVEDATKDLPSSS